MYTKKTHTILNESYIESQVVAYAKKRGYIVLKCNPINNRGIPDRLFIKKNKVFFIEFKKPNGKLRIAQDYMIQKLKYMGIKTYVVDNIDYGKKIISLSN